MTRSDAEMRAIRAVGFEWSEAARRTLAILEALGMLKLDEPKMERVSQSVMARAESALRVAIQVGGPDDPMEAADIIGCLDDAGLKIVEK